MYLRLFINIFLITALLSCNSSSNNDSSFSFKKTGQGIELLDEGDPVFFYQKKKKSPNGDFFFNNYIHPLYSLEGDMLTEEFPEDHFHHRGVFWAWHQIYIGDKNIGDGWIMENISTNVESVNTDRTKDKAQLRTFVLWSSPLYKNGKAFIEEHTSITVFKVNEKYRIIDFKIMLKPLIPDVSIGGSDNEKGYGGFCTRIKCPEDLVFTSETGQVTPQNLQIKAGPWMDFSASFGKKGKLAGLSLLCHPNTPNYVAPWILRQKESMQNIVFPGKDRIKLSADKPLVLYYRIIVHNGNADALDIRKLQAEYEKIN